MRISIFISALIIASAINHDYIQSLGASGFIIMTLLFLLWDLISEWRDK